MKVYIMDHFIEFLANHITSSFSLGGSENKPICPPSYDDLTSPRVIPYLTDIDTVVLFNTITENIQGRQIPYGLHRPNPAHLFGVFCKTSAQTGAFRYHAVKFELMSRQKTFLSEESSHPNLEPYNNRRIHPSIHP
jgi:hypothetical protein